MSKKTIIIIAAVIVGIFLLLLLFIGGSAGTKNIPTQEKIETNFSSVVCEVSGEEDISYDISTLTNNVQFDSKLQQKNYQKLHIQTTKNFQSLGVAFLVQSNSEGTLTFTLKKNGEVLKTCSVETEIDVTKNVDLVLEHSTEIKTTDDFYIEVNGSGEFIFDTILIFVDEV